VCKGLRRTSTLNSPVFFGYFVAFFVVFLDQVTKYLIKKSISLYHSVIIIPGFLNLVHIKNRGIAFGIFNSQAGTSSIGLIIISIVAVIFIGYLIFSEKKRGRFYCISLGMILGGAIGNLIDRIIFGEVTDFIDVYIKEYHWPAFNFADMAISVGGIFILLFIIKGKSHASNSDSNR